MKKEYPDAMPSEWGLEDWEKSLTIRVGSAFVCRECESIVMVTRGGIGVMELSCCGQPMLAAAPGGK